MAVELSFMRWRITAVQWLLLEMGCIALVALLLLLQQWVSAGGLGVLAALAQPYLHVCRARRVNVLDEQLEGWLTSLAATLRATPFLGEALEHSTTLVKAPLRDELEQTLKEQRLGVGLDEALDRMGQRVRSRTLQSVLGAVRIGRNTGGQLSAILERSAGTLREMARLEGVIRTKTAEGRAQTVVLAVMPAVMIPMLHRLNPDLLRPLVSGSRGYAVIATAVLLYLGAVFTAWKVLDVDI